MKFFFLLVANILVLSLMLTSCKKDTDLKDVKVSFDFSHNINGEILDFDTIKYTNAAGNNYSVSTLKYFVSSFTLTKTDGTKIFIDEIFYVDAVNGPTTFAPTLLIPGGDYQNLSFIFGLDEEHNVAGAFPNPPQNNMEWPLPLGGGYHYLKLEGKFDTTGSVKNYQAHTGRLMQNPHFIKETFPDFLLTFDGGDITFDISMDINSWWATPNTLNLNTISGIMGNENIQQELQENGADIFSLIIE